MIWVYYDESGEYASGRLVSMAIGGCVSTLEKWKRLEIAWKAILADECLPFFHMTDFQHYKKPFDFMLPDGGRDKERHNRILNRVLDTMVENIEGFHGFFCHDIPNDGRGHEAHQGAMEQCSVGAISFAIKSLWAKYRQPLHLVFAKQDHYPEIGRKYWQAHYDVDDSRIATRTEANANCVTQLQAADVFAYEVVRRARINRPLRYPFRRLVAGAEKNGARVTLNIGPFSAFRDRGLPGVPKVPGQP